MNTLTPSEAPPTDNRTVPLRPPNSALRTREHLTLAEVEKLIEVARGNRQGARDALMILLAFRHGLRAGEVCDLRWEQIDFPNATLHVRRIKNGSPADRPGTSIPSSASAYQPAKPFHFCKRTRGSAQCRSLLANGRASRG
jgi:integrase